MRRGRALVTVLVVGSVGAPAAARPVSAGSSEAVLAGKWHLHFSVLRREHLTRARGSTRTWVFRRACSQGHCRLRLAFELSEGGYEKFTIVRASARTWKGVRRGAGPYCVKAGRYTGTGVETVTIRATGTRRLGGRTTATEIEAYYRAALSGSCGGRRTTGSELRRFRGGRVDLGTSVS
jgi:hypothetical protein